MQDTKEYVVTPKLSHHLIGIALTGSVASCCAYLAMTNTSGLLTRRTDLSPEMLNIILWVFCAAAGLLCLIFLVEMILTQIRPVAKIRFTSRDFSIPMSAGFKRMTVTAGYDQITEVTVDHGAPNRFLRVYTTAGNATVAELNLEEGVFDEIHSALVKRAPRMEDQTVLPSAVS